MKRPDRSLAESSNTDLLDPELFRGSFVLMVLSTPRFKLADAKDSVAESTWLPPLEEVLGSVIWTVEIPGPLERLHWTFLGQSQVCNSLLYISPPVHDSRRAPPKTQT